MEFDSAPVAGGPSPYAVRDDLTFEVTRLSDVRRVFVTVRSTKWALKKITRNDTEITDSAIDLRTKHVEGVQIVLTPKVCPPDEYLAITMQAIVGFEYMDPDFPQQLRPLAASFSLQEGESRTLALKLKEHP